MSDQRWYRVWDSRPVSWTDGPKNKRDGCHSTEWGAQTMPRRTGKRGLAVNREGSSRRKKQVPGQSKRIEVEMEFWSKGMSEYSCL